MSRLSPFSRYAEGQINDWWDKLSDEYTYEEQCDLHGIGAVDMDRWY